MRFDRTICSDLPLARSKEWLEANGIGGFASSTIVGMNTRRYHGLLVAATRPPVGRIVMLSKFEEILWTGNRAYELSTNQYRGAVHPKGYSLQDEFSRDLMPRFVYEVDGVRLEKTVFMIHGENSTAVSYRLVRDPRRDVRLQLRPLMAFRDYHNLTHANPHLDGRVQAGEGWLSVRPYPDLPELFLNHNGGELLEVDGWYYNFEYEAERERGLDWHEDLFSPFALWFELSRCPAYLVASTEHRAAERMEEMKSKELSRRELLFHSTQSSDDFVKSLLFAADQFVVKRGKDLTVIAGYHWFTDWGRDTMIALPGLTLIPGHYEKAKKILCAFAQACDRGMLPNRFPDTGEEPEYNTVDATLWFFQAIYSLARKTGDYDFVRERLYATLQEIIRWHIQGTRYNIKVDEDGLLNSGQPGAQLTWMDAKVGDWVVTARSGKPVEIQALWYNALRIMEHFAGEFGDGENGPWYARLSSQAAESFNEKFWNRELNCFYDCIDRDQRDPAIRPNQIFAVSLPFSMLPAERMRAVVEVVSRELLTPVGLRSLSPGDPVYQGHYGGDGARRDGAYHQGTVWSWLMGPFITALVRANDGSRESREQGAALLEGLKEHLNDAGLGTISEIFDGDPPHAPRGCIAQAWSVAEVLRCAVEDLRRNSGTGIF